MSQYRVHGYYIITPFIEDARRRHPEIADHFHVCSLLAPRTDQVFDTIVTLRTLRNISDKALAARNIVRLLNPGGRWIFNHLPEPEARGSFSELLQRAELRILASGRYDHHAALSGMGRISAVAHRRYVKSVDAGLVPYSIFRMVEALNGRHGTRLYVCERA